MTIDRQALKAQLRSRSTESYNRRDAWSDTSIGILDTNIEIQQFASIADKTTAFIDVIPFIAGRYWPTRLNFGAPGQWAPHMEIFVHNNVGPSNAQYVCPLANWGQPCPICEQQTKLRDKWATPTEEQKSIIKSLYPQRRCLYNVIHSNDDKTIAKGAQVMNLSHFSLQKQLESLIVGRSGQPEIFYADPDEGKTIRFTRDGVGINTSYIGIAFVDRDYKISEEELADAYILDEILALPKDPKGEVLWHAYYTTISNSFFASEGEELDEELDEEVLPPPARTRKAPMSTTAQPQARATCKTTPVESIEEEDYEEEEVTTPIQEPAPTRRVHRTTQEQAPEVPQARATRKSAPQVEPIDEELDEEAETAPPSQPTTAPARATRKPAPVEDNKPPFDTPAEAPVRSRRRMS